MKPKPIEERKLTPYEIERNKLIPQATQIADGTVGQDNPMWSQIFMATMDRLWRGHEDPKL